MKMMTITMSICLALSFMNCATFKGDISGKFESPAARNAGAGDVRVFFIFSHLSQTKGYDAIPKLDSERQRIRGFDDFFQYALNELSNIRTYSTFTNDASDVNDPERRTVRDSLMHTHDYVMKITFRREKSFAAHTFGKIISSASLTTVPVPYKYTYTVEVQLLNSKGRLIKNYSRGTALTKWVQTLMIFVYPFHPEKRKKEEIYVEFLHDIFKQIETEKVLN
ncbi:hypothetical protein JW948_00665 [bacterium]|nr:hypothetical protein [bacterium]